MSEMRGVNSVSVLGVFRTGVGCTEGTLGSSETSFSFWMSYAVRYAHK